MAPQRQPKSKIPNSVRHKVLCLRLDQYSYSDIQNRTGLSRSTIAGIIKRFRTTGTYHDNPPQRQKKLTPHLLRRIRREVEKSPRAPLADITNSSQLNIHPSTIYTAMKKMQYRSRIARAKPYHDRQSRRVRLEWCKLRKRWGLMEWRNRIWSDEVVVQIGRNGKVRVWRRKGTAYSPRYTILNFSDAKLSVMFWAAIGYNVRTTLTPIRRRGRHERTGPHDHGGLNANQYISDILEGVLLPFWREIHGWMGDMEFMQDGAKCHKARKVLSWFRRRRIVLMPWPPRSPDLNPIENCWQLLKKRLAHRWYKTGRRPKTRAELIQQSQEEWDRISQDAVNNLVDSMLHRVKSCIRLRGASTKY